MARSFQEQSSSAAPWCVLSAMCLALVISHITAFVAGSSAVSGTSPAVIHSTFTLPSPTSQVPQCDRIFISNPYGPKNGTFSVPYMENPESHSRQCIYTFMAAENERVRITFTSFNIRGSWPQCNHEYIDLYMEIEDSSADLINTPFGGRICGRNRPNERISMHQVLVIAFYTDERTLFPDILSGTYDFIDAAQYVVGTPTPNTVCNFTIYSDRKETGDLLSPTYPGVYPKNLGCQYRFLGRKGQRVRLEFMDFDLFYGGSHCPFDFVKIYDGASDKALLIGTYCGQLRNLVVYSSSENLHLIFTTLQRTADTSNRGFSAVYEFSNRYVNLDFINEDGEHIRGTECDQKILSKKGSNGTVNSPNHPYPYYPNIVCRYYIYGMQDAQRLERVRLRIEKLGIPSDNSTECTDGYLRLYLQGQEERYALEEFDHNLCGHVEHLSFLSEGPRLVMVFNSGGAHGEGFKATYVFETDYKVPGTAAPNGTCSFTYLSESRKTGEFNSPHYPANYPSNTLCEYFFLGLQGEQVSLVFNYFKTKMEDETYGYNDICREDWVEIYEIYSTGRDKKLGRYCGHTAPGPVMSDVGVNTVKVVLSTDETGVASGFTATYHFFPAINKYEDCGRNITRQKDGVIASPGFPGYQPHRQLCNWYITVRPEHRILLYFDFFLIEGAPERRGCPGAVVRVWPELSQPPVEMCGESLSNATREITSTSNILKLSFVTADKAVGAKGFRATWTEVKDGSDCDQFLCAVSRFCVAHTTKCNNLPNCGFEDNSDEFECMPLQGIDIYMVVGLSLGGAVLTVITMCAVFHRKCKRRRSSTSQPDPRRKPAQEVPAMPFISVDSV